MLEPSGFRTLMLLLKDWWLEKVRQASIELSRELAGGLGFEPRLAESESAVLPLDDPPLKNSLSDFHF